MFRRVPFTSVPFELLSTMVTTFFAASRAIVQCLLEMKLLLLMTCVEAKNRRGDCRRGPVCPRALSSKPISKGSKLRILLGARPIVVSSRTRSIFGALSVLREVKRPHAACASSTGAVTSSWTCPMKGKPHRNRVRKERQERLYRLEARCYSHRALNRVLPLCVPGLCSNRLQRLHQNTRDDFIG